MKQERIYHILIDRFFPIRDEDTNGNFKGGCIRSIIEHLDYIQGLGMSGIMLTPFYKTASYRKRFRDASRYTSKKYRSSFYS